MAAIYAKNTGINPSSLKKTKTTSVLGCFMYIKRGVEPMALRPIRLIVVKYRARGHKCHDQKLNLESGKHKPLVSLVL